MKSLLKTNKLAELMALAFMLPSAALAQGSGSHGGGEDGVFKSIRDEIGGWIQKNSEIGQLENKLELKSMTGAELQRSFANAIRDVGEKVVFTQKELKIGENSRICTNENKIITCNVAAWNASRGDTRYMIVLHEYLGIAGIETNVETDYSRYPISSKILGYVKSKEAFELSMDKNNEFNYPKYQEALIDSQSNMDVICQLLLNSNEAKSATVINTDYYPNGGSFTYLLGTSRNDLEIQSSFVKRKVVKYLKCELPASKTYAEQNAADAAAFLMEHPEMIELATKKALTMFELPQFKRYSREIKYLKTERSGKCLDCDVPDAPNGQQHQPQAYETTTKYFFELKYDSPYEVFGDFTIILKKVSYDIQANMSYQYDIEVVKK